MPEESLGQFAKEFRELDEPFREMLKKLEQDLSSLEEDSNVKNYLKKIEELRLLEQGLLNIKIQNARGYAKKRHALPKNYSPEDEMFDAWCKEGYQTYIEQGSYQYTRKI